MIEIRKLDEANDVGRWVVYRPDHGVPQVGKIKSWNDLWIFVVYKCADEWERFYDYTAEATDPEKLQFVE